MSTEVAKIEKSNGFLVVDITKPLPKLSELELLPFDLMADYWTPEEPGESKRLIFIGIEDRTVLDQESGKTIDLECANFLEEDENGNIRTISNGSKRLVGLLEKMKPYTAIYVKFLGKKKNRTNSFKSDNWSVIPFRKTEDY
ncbi:hypothetical protein [Parapedobacter lycopersici]|uniref:hypothetical protein n=1 Tax=Parapedobacter lycopersici TaxID=1864939 RepID=UPI00214D748E|nr:hypothetical protein [Parapedobacter lycopersici]